MRTVYMIPMLIVALFAQVTMTMAQNASDENKVDDAIYGIYTGDATTTYEEHTENGEKITQGENKKDITIEIKKSKEEGYTTVTLKDFKMGQYEFSKIPFEQGILRYPDGKRWQIYLESNLNDYFNTKDNKTQVLIGGLIDEDNSYVYKNGDMELDFSLTHDYKTYIRYKFKGKKGTKTGIHKLNVGKTENTVFDLQGSRVSHPTKGIYIVNGKKVVY